MKFGQKLEILWSNRMQLAPISHWGAKFTLQNLAEYVVQQISAILQKGAVKDCVELYCHVVTTVKASVIFKTGNMKWFDALNLVKGKCFRTFTICNTCTHPWHLLILINTHHTLACLTAESVIRVSIRAHALFFAFFLHIHFEKKYSNLQFFIYIHLLLKCPLISPLFSLLFISFLMQRSRGKECTEVWITQKKNGKRKGKLLRKIWRDLRRKGIHIQETCLRYFDDHSFLSQSEESKFMWTHSKDGTTWGF